MSWKTSNGTTTLAKVDDDRFGHERADVDYIVMD